MLVIFNSTTGAVIEHVVSTSGISMTGKGQKAIPAGYTSDTHSWDATARQYVEDAAKVEARLLAAIDEQRETLQMAVLTAGGAKKYVYSRKAVEAIDARGLVTTILNALSLTDKQKRFPFAQAEAALTGEQISVVLGRYEAAMNTSAARVAAIDAVAQKAKRAVRAASTPAAKTAAAAGINWTA